MMVMRRRLVCCSREREVSLDFDQQERIITYDGLESCILNSHTVHTYENGSGTSRGDPCTSDSLLDEDTSSCSSSNNASGSFASNWTLMKKDEPDEWEVADSPKHLYAKEKPAFDNQVSDFETMKERFSKLLLGEDITGGCKGVSTALALSNAITNLAASVFGELWKLEPLSEERKNRWRREMDWLLSPTNYMIELVPAKQHGSNGRTLEIMTPKARADIHMNLPALEKLDSMLIEMLDSMIENEFWYVEGGSRAEGRSSIGRRPTKKWWLPSPRVPITGLSDAERKKLVQQGKMVNQVFKATKSINENVLLEMPIPDVIRQALPKSGKTSLGEDLYRNITAESPTAEEMLHSLNLKSEHRALEVINKLEAAAFAWKEQMAVQSSDKSPVRTSWSFLKDSMCEIEKLEFLVNQAESLVQIIKTKFPNTPQSFLDVTKVQYGKDVGKSIIEAYSRVLGNLAFSILSRIRDILQEEIRSNPTSPAVACNIPGLHLNNNSDHQKTSLRVRHALSDGLNIVPH